MLDSGSPFAIVQPPGAEAKNALALRRLRHAVLSCELKPGQTVAEAELAERYRLGRASVRVALTQLAQAGFVAPRARQGWQVVPVTGGLIGEILAARRRIEPALAELRPAGRERDRIAALIAMNSALLRDDSGAGLATARINDRQIMDLLAARLGGFEARWLAQVFDHSERALTWLEQAGARWRPADRAALLEALCAGDAAAARATLAEALQAFQDFVTAGLLRLPVQLPAQAPARRRRGSGQGPGVLQATTTRTGKVT